MKSLYIDIGNISKKGKFKSFYTEIFHGGNGSLACFLNCMSFDELNMLKQLININLVAEIDSAINQLKESNE
jgi:hypothetical protein